MEKKYILTDETMNYKGVTLHRIQAIRDFGDVKAGDLGGWIEKEFNLSQFDKAWVYGNAMVFDNARVLNNAWIFGNAKVFGDANVFDNVIVFDNAKVFDNAGISDNVWICGNAQVCGNARVADRSKVCDYAVVCGYAVVLGYTEVCGDAIIQSPADCIVFNNWWSSGNDLIWTRSNNRWKTGCFYGTGEQLIAKAYQDSEKSGRECERIVKYVKSILDEGQKKESAK